MSWLSRLFGFGAKPAPPPPAPLPIPVSTVGEAPLAVPRSVLHDVPRVAMLTARDRQRLVGVHPDLVRVVERARRDVEFYVSEGLRTVERQRALVASGASRTMNSRHLTGHAVDLYPVSDVPVKAMKARDFVPVVEAMKRAAAAEGVRMEHGADWGWDSPHHELHRDVYR